MKVALALLIAVLAFWALGAHNRLVRLRLAARTAFAPLSAQLRERQAVARALAAASRELPLGPASADSHPVVDLLAATQAAEAAHGLAPSRRLRGEALRQMSVAEEALGHELDRLRLLLQDYTSGDGPVPMLTELLRQHETLQQQIVVSREVYHRAAHGYNLALDIFPTTLIAAVFRFHPVPEFLVGPAER